MNKIELPGAEKFVRFLEDHVSGELTIEGPETVDIKEDNGKYARRWTVKNNGAKLGEYLTSDPKPGETEFGREYRGRVPGYVNDHIQIANLFHPENLPLDQVSLVWDSQKFQEQSISIRKSKRPERLVDTTWQRYDGHSQIPFP